MITERNAPDELRRQDVRNLDLQKAREKGIRQKEENEELKSAQPNGATEQPDWIEAYAVLYAGVSCVPCRKKTVGVKLE